MNTPDLFHDTMPKEQQPALVPRARQTDPRTSHEAGDSVDGLTEKRSDVLCALKRFGPVTQEELVVAYYENGLLHGWCHQSVSGLRTRCSELVRMGLVVDTGITRKTRSGRNAVVWGVKP